MAVDTKTGSFFVYKQKEPFNDTDRDSLIDKKRRSLNNFNYFLFHSRAPTNCVETEWSAETTHPFNQDNCYVAHNGIITNFEKLNENLNFKVDTQLIPFNLVESQNIHETYSKLEGLLTSWIVWDNKIYLVKAGSSLWMDEDSFSSSKFDKSNQIEEDGIIFEYQDLVFKKCGEFPYVSTYFI